MIKDIYIFRHGETDWNKTSTIQGTIDIPLNETGLQQARKIAKHLTGKNITKIYSSPLRRAFKTAQIVAETLMVEILQNDELKEVDFGLASGEQKKNLGRLFKDENIYEKWRCNDSKYDTMRFPEGESKLEARNRILNCLCNTASSIDEDVLCFSSHGFVIKQLIIASKEENCMGLQNCEIVHFTFDEDKFINKEDNCLQFVRRIDTQV